MALQRQFSRLAIVNRGEAAMRLIRAVRELNELGDRRIETIALYTEPERQATFVRWADDAYCLGPAITKGPDGQQRSGYLDYAALERALRAVNADAAWVGWGFVAERPEFAELCERLGIVFVGPDAATMRLLGDKISAKQIAERAGVPVAPWSGGPVDTIEDAIESAREIGFPLMIKASAGGGGRGIRRVDEPGELPVAFDRARAEALKAFGDPTMLLERLIAPARHIEVQVIADAAGGAWAVGVRDCSYQRRNQKVIEETSSPALTAGQETEIKEAARRLVLEVGYQNAGTVEFLYQPDERQFSFMEVNARLQVEHPVTEMVTGLDLVKLQLLVAAGGRLEGDPPPARGHAIEARLNAEDPALDFAPAPGRVIVLRLPSGPGVRVDHGVGVGDVIPIEFDSMIAKIIAHGSDREESIARLRRALRETTAVIEGGTTNQGFLLELLAHPDLRSGAADTGWLDRAHPSGKLSRAPHPDVALLQAAIELHDQELATQLSSFYAFARRGRPKAGRDTGQAIDLRERGQMYRLFVRQIGPSHYCVEVDGATIEVEVDRLGERERRLCFDQRAFRTAVSRQAAEVLVEVDGFPHRVSRDDGGLVRSHAPGVVVSIPVESGDEVAEGDVIAVLESMKMESSLTAPYAGRVREVLVALNAQVGAHTPLVRLAQPGAQHESGGEERVPFASSSDRPAAAPERCLENLRRLEWLVMGYDLADAEVEEIVSELHGACSDFACSPQLVPNEHMLLRLVADLRVLSRPRHEEDPDRELLRSPQEYLFAFLRSFDAEAEGLPERFVELLRRALRHYEIDSLDRTPALEDACYRIFVSHQRVDPQRAAVIAILDRRLEAAADLIGRVPDEFREVLDQLEAAMEGRDEAVADLVREVRYRYYDEPVIQAAREAVYESIEEELAALSSSPDRPDRAARIAVLVESPQVLAPLLTSRMRSADAPLRRVLVEAMTGRYYRVHSLSPCEEQVVGGIPFVCSGYEDAGRRHRLVAAFIDLKDLTGSVSALARLAERADGGECVVADFYAEHGEPALRRVQLAARLRDCLAETPLPDGVERVVFAIAEPRRGRGMSAVDLFTFRRSPDGAFVEDEFLRGLHPMMAERLHLWRLAEFELERLRSAEDIYLYRGIARTNPKDERLFGIAEVRDLTPLRDDRGRLVALPEFERALGQTLEAMREFQAHREPGNRLLWNRVQLCAWPTIDLEPDELRPVIQRFARTTGGLGIEQVGLRGTFVEDGVEQKRNMRFFSPTGHGVVVEADAWPTRPIQPLDESARRIIQARRRGAIHPSELVRLLIQTRDTDGARSGGNLGSFVEHDFDDGERLAPVARPPALNDAGVVVGIVRNFTERYPEGMERVVLMGDPTKALGSLAEPECRRIIAAIDLAEDLGVPLEWFALSAGAKIAMDSGSENMDWIAAVLRRIIEFTQAGGEVNVVVTGVNVGAQPYWNAEATMLMHTRGILIMTPDSAMVLTGKQALDYSGGVSAEDNFGIGGYERIMGPNGQAQYWASDVAGACRLLLAHYEHTYVAPGERFPRRAATADPLDRDVGSSPHRLPGSELQLVGDIFSDEANSERKQPFDIRSVMRATIDQDHLPLERWAGWRAAEMAVVWDAYLGGWPVTLLGVESHPRPRHGFIPADGPEQWTSGTLFPQASRKIARAINAASGNRPLVVLANLTGFDGSPESMTRWQLEYGAEIGRAVVNFDGPIVFCVVSRYHGGAFVVFSQKLNEDLETVALEGARASVIGGAPAAAVVFAREVKRRAAADPRIVKIDERIEAAQGADRQRLRAERTTLWTDVHAEKLGQLAAEFDAVHSVERAVEVGSVSRIIPPRSLRPFLVDAVERGMRRTLEKPQVLV